MALTDAKIRNMKPKERPYKVSDFEGLYVQVTPAGSKLLKVKYRLDGRERKLSLGAYLAVRRAYARDEHWNERVRLEDWWALELDRLSKL